MAVAALPSTTAAVQPSAFGASTGSPPGRRPLLGQIVAVVALQAGWCNADLAAAWRTLGIDADLLAPETARRRIRSGDIVINRLDVRPSLDGIEPGLVAMRTLERIGARIVNPPAALEAAHDKLATAELLAAAGVPHPRTVHVPSAALAVRGITPPLVLKPRFGSWGADVMLCRTGREVEAGLAYAAGRQWFRSHGAIAQAYVPHTADLRLVIAGRRLVGAVERRPARGEWRTNFSLGGSRRPVVPPSDAADMAAAACDAVGADLAGVDLIAVPGGYVVLEVNGSVDFDRSYSLPGRDAYSDVAAALDLPAPHRGLALQTLIPRGRPAGLPLASWHEARWA